MYDSSSIALSNKDEPTELELYVLISIFANSTHLGLWSHLCHTYAITVKVEYLE